MSNHETERARLASVYSKMSDEELAQILADEKSLTDVAKSALEAELASRGIERNKSAASAAKELALQEQHLGEVDASQHSGPLVTVRQYRDLPEALIAKSILDSAQLDSFLADETMVRFSWFYSNLIGGAKLMVRPEDLEEAARLLAEASLSGSELSDGSPNRLGESTNEDH